MLLRNWLIWGFVATTVLTTIMTVSQQLRMTRMNLPFILGTMFTSNRDKANAVGFLIHFINGWIFSLVHMGIYQSIGFSSWYLGALLGLAHGIIVMTILMPIVPAFHPRMASEYQSPTDIRQLEPPGFMGMHYGIRTPISSIVAHIIYGIILGAFYRAS